MADIYVERTDDSFKVKPQTVRRSGGLSTKWNTSELICIRMGGSGAYVCYDGHRKPHWMETKHKRKDIEEECRKKNIPLIDLSEKSSHVSRNNIIVMNENTEDWNVVMTPQVINDLNPCELITKLLLFMNSNSDQINAERGNVALSVGFTGMNVKLTVKSVSSPSILKTDVEMMVKMTTIFQRMHTMMNYSDQCPFPQGTVRHQEFAQSLCETFGVDGVNVFEQCTWALTCLGDLENVLDGSRDLTEKDPPSMFGCHVDSSNDKSDGYNVFFTIYFHQRFKMKWYRIALIGYSRASIQDYYVRLDSRNKLIRCIRTYIQHCIRNRRLQLRLVDLPRRQLQ
mmetsp:Transcript_19000/g.28891  ORF Transcript_19000/g.28891 Transcript_19000/m.28891 type:complete len:340 (+) Transcript_19000:274-1293(+)